MSQLRDPAEEPGPDGGWARELRKPRSGSVWPGLKEGVRREGRGCGHKRATRGILVAAEMSVFMSALLCTTVQPEA